MRARPLWPILIEKAVAAPGATALRRLWQRQSRALAPEVYQAIAAAGGPPLALQERYTVELFGVAANNLSPEWTAAMTKAASRLTERGLRFNVDADVLEGWRGVRMVQLAHQLARSQTEALGVATHLLGRENLSPEQMGPVLQRIVGVTPTQARSAVRYYLARVEASGEPAALRDLRTLVTQQRQTRAEAIARTERTAAAAVGAQAAAAQAQEQGIAGQIDQVWRVMDRPCDDCEPLDGTLGPWPALPPLHPNCGCEIALEAA